MWLETKRLKLERMPGSSEAALNFVGDDERAGLCRRLVDRRGEGRCERSDTAITLNAFRDDRCCLGRHRREQRRRIVRQYETDAGDQRLERCAVVFVRCHRERTEGAPVKRSFERDEFGARFLLRIPIATSELQA